MSGLGDSCAKNALAGESVGALEEEGMVFPATASKIRKTGDGRGEGNWNFDTWVSYEPRSKLHSIV